MTPKTIGELIFWSYANLAMAEDGVKRGIARYDRLSFMIRSRLYKGLTSGSMKIHSLFDDERYKILNGARCVYCGSEGNLSVDHMIPRASGGSDSSDNLMCCCKKCNSSKGDRNLIEWYEVTGRFVPLRLLRRYMKLVFMFCQDNGLLDEDVGSLDGRALPFSVKTIPVDFPNPDQLEL